MKPFGQFKWILIRWAEKLGRPECPYLIRWTFIILGLSIRIHHWLRSDDNRYFHDHSCDLVSMILKGWYYNVVPADPANPEVKNCRKIKVTPFKPRRMKAIDKHYLEVPKGGAWTILLCGRPKRHWGFFVNNHLWRPLRYFHKFGIIQDSSYQ